MSNAQKVKVSLRKPIQMANAMKKLANCKQVLKQIQSGEMQRMATVMQLTRHKKAVRLGYALREAAILKRELLHEIEPTVDCGDATCLVRTCRDRRVFGGGTRIQIRNQVIVSVEKIPMSEAAIARTQKRKKREEQQSPSNIVKEKMKENLEKKRVQEKTEEKAEKPKLTSGCSRRTLLFKTRN